MSKQLIRSLCVSSLLAVAAASVSAQNTGSTSGDKPVFQWGGDFRVRYEAYTNAQTLSSAVAFNDRDYFRVRLRLWETTNPLPDLTLFGRISAEPRYWFNNSTVAGEGKEWKYFLFDNLYAKWTTNAAGTPVTVVLGRQDIQLGDQWLVGDGTPLDGSWTNHVDGLRVTIDAKDLKTKFEVIAFNQQAKPGDRLPILGAKRTYAITEQDETGVILYASNKSIKDTQLDGYFIYKGDSAVTGAGDSADIYTLGTKISGSRTENWQYSAEGAYQWGRRNLLVRQPVVISGSRDVSAYGLNAKLTYLFKDTYSNQLTFLAEYLSGDRAGSTGTDEMFDNLWGRYPRIGETWAAAYAMEEGGRSSQFNNLIRLGATWTIAPSKATTVASTYCAMFAPEGTPTRATNITRFGGGNFRGHMLQVVVKHKFSKSLSGLLFAEASFMGDYYARHDTMTFLRAEMLVSF